MADYEVNIGVSVETSELDSTEKRINDLVNNKHTIKIDTSNSTKKIDDITDSVKNAQKAHLLLVMYLSGHLGSEQPPHSR